MIESYPLITTIVASVVAAFLLGLIANRLKLPAILGYLCAGMVIGPHTPGFVANIELAKQLAEIGIILLMFGVGLHFSLKDLIAVNKIATPGALLQIICTTVIGIVAAMLMGHNFLEGIIFGVAISVASTVVLLRSLEHYHMISSDVGKIAVGWLIVEDIAMVLAIVLLPMIANSISAQSDLKLNEILYQVFYILLKIAAFTIVMVFAARKVLPGLLVYIAKAKSIELMSLGTLSIAMGFAFIAYTLFGASFALGAFLAGLVLNESEIGRKAAQQSLPLRDTFAVLFFISVGMLFDPSVITREPLMVLATFAIIVIAKPFAAYVITRLFRRSVADSLVIAVSLGQIGEFSFILSGLALKMGIFSQHLSDLILAGAILSIACNPFLFKIAKNFQSSNRIFLPNFN
jgi:CPA2 family monovalent cation:H+ antiporter-2